MSTHHIFSREPPALAGWAAGGTAPWTWDRALSPQPQSSAPSCQVCSRGLKNTRPDDFAHEVSLSLPITSNIRKGPKVSQIESHYCLRSEIFWKVLTFEEPLDDVIDVDLPLGHGWCLCRDFFATNRWVRYKRNENQWGLCSELAVSSERGGRSCAASSLVERETQSQSCTIRGHRAVTAANHR